MPTVAAPSNAAKQRPVLVAGCREPRVDPGDGQRPEIRHGAPAFLIGFRRADKLPAGAVRIRLHVPNIERGHLGHPQQPIACNRNLSMTLRHWRRKFRDRLPRFSHLRAGHGSRPPRAGVSPAVARWRPDRRGEALPLECGVEAFEGGCIGPLGVFCNRGGVEACNGGGRSGERSGPDLYQRLFRGVHGAASGKEE